MPNQATLTQLKNELAILENRKISIEENTVVEQVAKTLVVHTNCTKPADLIIW